MSWPGYVHKATYNNAHKRVATERGKASAHACSVCSGPAHEWAYTHADPCPDEQVDGLGQKFSMNVQRYVPMCRSCHRLYDAPPPTEFCRRGIHHMEGDNLLDVGRAGPICRECRNANARRNRKPRSEASRQQNRDYMNARNLAKRESHGS